MMNILIGRCIKLTLGELALYNDGWKPHSRLCIVKDGVRYRMTELEAIVKYSKLEVVSFVGNTVKIKNDEKTSIDGR